VESHLQALLGRETKSFAQNAFGVTKADDFSDEEINRFWVELGSVSSAQLLKPTRLMPMFIRGGKGSGKTHLLRHFSLTSESISQNEKGEPPRLGSSLGVYVRCGGLNSTRFSRKSEPEEKWLALFQYSLDLWLAQSLLSRITEVTATSAGLDLGSVEESVSKAVCRLFDDPPDEFPGDFKGLLNLLRDYHREIDLAITNFPLTRKLEVRIRTSPGRLIFGIPEVLSEGVPAFSNTTVLYLLDEMELLSILQQKYINSLIRHRKRSCSFRLGARLYGIKTYETLDGETNRAGSEFDVLELDSHWWQLRKQYKAFCENLCTRRLREAAVFPSALDDSECRRMLKSSMHEPSSGNFYRDYALTLVSKYKSLERPYFVRIREKLLRYAVGSRELGVPSEREADAIIRVLAFEEYPLLEKINLYLLYKDWARRRNLTRSASRIRKQCEEFIGTSGKGSRNYFYAYQHFSGDMLAQLTRDSKNRVRYVGLDTFISMSSGLPRNLLNILKNVFDWAIFNGETPFANSPISVETQERAVVDSSQWFFDEATPKQDAAQVQQGIGRLATLFRAIRYSDKPSECSLSTFSCSRAGLSERTQEILKLAEDWSMLIRHKRGQKYRNSKRVDEKYQLSPMLAPNWELPISRRGALALTAEEVNAIFADLDDLRFREVHKMRMERMNVPFHRSDSSANQAALPGLR
jgi:hypothetical protein